MEYDGSEPLDNLQHEEFCHHFIRTRSIKDAGLEIGVAKRQNANTVHKRPDVTARIAFLKNEILEELGLDTYYVLKNLKSIAERCMQAEAVEDKEGNPVFIQGEDGKYSAMFKFDATNAIKASELIGKHVGMFKDKVELTGKDGGPIQTETKDVTLEEYIKARKGILDEY